MFIEHAVWFCQAENLEAMAGDETCSLLGSVRISCSE